MAPPQELASKAFFQGKLWPWRFPLDEVLGYQFLWRSHLTRPWKLSSKAIRTAVHELVPADVEEADPSGSVSIYAREFYSLVWVGEPWECVCRSLWDQDWWMDISISAFILQYMGIHIIFPLWQADSILIKNNCSLWFFFLLICVSDCTCVLVCLSMPLSLYPPGTG